IEFEIEVSSARFGLREEFDTTVFPDLAAILRAFAQYVTIIHLKDAVNAAFVIQQTSARSRSVRRTLRTKMRDLQRFGFAPRGIVPVRIEPSSIGSSVDRVCHRRQNLFMQEQVINSRQ